MCCKIYGSQLPITYERWLDVSEEIKKACWNYVTTHYILDPNSRKHTLQSIGTKWKNFKHYLYKKFILPVKDDPDADLLTPPAMYPHLKVDDWKLFVAQRLSKKWEEKSKKAKITRAQNKYNHRLSRKGYSGLIAEIMQETGKAEEEIDRVVCWKRARELKRGGYDPNVKKIVDKINKIVKNAKKDINSLPTKKDGGRKLEDKNAKKDEEKTAKRVVEKTAKDTGKESKKEKKRQRELVEENQKEFSKKGYELITGEAIQELKDKKKTKVDEKETMHRKMTRGQRNTRVRMEKNVPLRMVAMMVDGQVLQVDSIKVWCDDNLFGYDSFTYLNWNDFNKLFSMGELSGAVVTSYTMYLYEQIKNGSKEDHGICFMSPTATMQHERKAKAKNVDDSSKLVAERLSTRNDNHIILLPYNPGRHWVLGVLDMKRTTCYFLDSLGPSIVDRQFKQIVDAEIVLYNVRSGSQKMNKLKWVISKVFVSKHNLDYLKCKLCNLRSLRSIHWRLAWHSKILILF